jgi:hypothetical protein
MTPNSIRDQTENSLFRQCFKDVYVPGLEVRLGTYLRQSSRGSLPPQAATLFSNMLQPEERTWTEQLMLSVLCFMFFVW